jgi:uncharacterized repeat protein (TIGR01451 family)
MTSRTRFAAFRIGVLFLGFGASSVSAGTISPKGAPAGGPAPPPGCGALSTSTFTTPASAPIPDSGQGSVPGMPLTSTINVTGMGPYLYDVNLQTFIMHTFPSDLDVTISHGGKTVTLTTDNGGGADNVFNGTVWDDDADPDGIPTANPALANPNQVQLHPYSDGVVATPLAPEEGLAAFIGDDPNGVWTLAVVDDDGFSLGTLGGWSLTVATLSFTPNGTPTSGFSNTVLQIPPGGPSTTGVVTSQIPISVANGQILDVNLTTFITHAGSDDLAISLTSPQGTTVSLTNGRFVTGGGADDVFNGTLWDDGANPGGTLPYVTNTGLASDHNYQDGVVATPLAPVEGLGAFVGEDPIGVWTLTVADQSAGSGGSLDGWALGIIAGGCNAFAADLTIVKSDSPDPVAPDTDLTYTIVIANNGPSDAQNVVVTDALPAGTVFVSAIQTAGPAFPVSGPAVGTTGTVTATADTLPVGGSATFSVVVHVNGALPAGSTLLNTAGVASSTTDVTPGNNSVTQATGVSGGAVTRPEVPTLSGWMLVLFAVGLASLGARLVRNV